MEILVGVAIGILVVGLLWLVVGVKFTNNQPNPGKQLTVEEMTELIKVITEEHVRGVRSVLGLDLGKAEIVTPEEAEEEDGPIAFVNQLEMDPFMMLDEEMAQWDENPPGQQKHI